MKKLNLILLVALLLTACGPAPQDVVNSWAEALNKGDIDAALSFLADDATVAVVPPGPDGDGIYNGHAEIRGWYETTVSAKGVATLSECKTEGETVTFTATVTHPDGTAAIAGGSLTTPNGAFTYGPFVLAGGSTYSVDVTWDQINSIETIEFTNDDTRSFRAVFYDTSARQGVQSADLRMTCEEGAACDGVCIDLQIDNENCGECRRECIINGVGGCSDGDCLPTMSSCNPWSSDLTCDEICTNEGGNCVPESCQDHTVIYYGTNAQCINFTPGGDGDFTCNEILPDTNDYFRCCCDLNP